MNIIVCLDDKNGYCFFGKRQSKDKVLRERVLSLTSKSVLWMNEYSAKQFEEGGDFRVDNDFLHKASGGEYCFIENTAFTLDNTEKVIIYKWNRRYPADMFFTYDLCSEGYTLVSSCEFAGNSHDTITEEIYAK